MAYFNIKVNPYTSPDSAKMPYYPHMSFENAAKTSSPSPEAKPKPKGVRARMEELKQAHAAKTKELNEAEELGDEHVEMELEREDLEEVTGEREIPMEDLSEYAEEIVEEPKATLRDRLQRRQEAGQKAHEQLDKMEIQSKDVVPAFEIQGFDGLEVTATLEKKSERKGKEAKNEDNVILDPETGLMGVLDGLGGEGSGDKASMSAERNLPAHFKKGAEAMQKKGVAEVVKGLVESQMTRVSESPADRERVTKQMEDIMVLDPKMGRKALLLLEAMKATNEDVKDSKGKTTACVGFIHKAPNGESYAVVANIGDSAAYKRRKDGSLVELTKEDSLLNVLQSSGSLTPELFQKMKASPKEKMPIPLSLELVQAAGGGKADFEKMQANNIKSLPMSYEKLKKSMVGALGSSGMEAALTVRRLDPGDELIMVTDGVADYFEDMSSETLDTKALADALEDSGTGTERLNYLRETAKRRSQQAEYAHKAEGDDIAIIKAKVL